MVKKHIRKVVYLSRLMSYILGNRPYEYGLVPDKDGYITIKEFLRAINEEPSMAYVRESHLREVLLHVRDGIFEIDGKRIRSTEQSFSAVNREQEHAPPPKILFSGVKRKAYAHILRSGLLPGAKEYVVMTPHRELALQIAHRFDQNPIVLEVRAGAANESGIPFYPFGDCLYLSDRVPVDFISGPPLPKELPPKKEPLGKEKGIAPGSFVLRPERDPDLKRRRSANKKITWKEDVKKTRKRGRVGPGKNWLQEPF